MKDWSFETLGSFGELTSSKRIYLSDYVSEGVPFYRSKEIIEKAEGKTINDPLFIDKNKFENIKSKFGAPMAGDILITAVGTLGVIYQVKESDHFYFKDGNLIWLRNIKKGINRKYVYQLLKSNYGKGLLDETAIGTSQPAYTIVNLKKIKLPLPLMHIQRKIAAVLSTYHDLIENNNRRIAILEKMAEELYREWFVRLRFLGHEKVKIVKGVPEGWEVKRIGDILSFKYGYTESAIEDNQYPKFLRVMDINKTSYIKWSEVPNCKIDENEKEKYLLKKSDLVIARMASPGKVAIIERDINAVFASYLIKMTLDINNILPYYAFYTLTNDYYQGLFSNADTSATRGNINGQIISRFQIIIPPLELQKLFEKQILSIRNTLNNFVIQNETLTIIRDRLLTRLMSGKIDVENLDIQFPDSMKEEAAAHA